MTEKNYIPYLSEEEKELAQLLGQELTSIAKDLPAGNLDITTVDIVTEADGGGNMRMIISEEATNPKSYKTK